MRRYYLEDSIGRRYDFQQSNKVFLDNPSDLGFEFDNEYVKVGNTFVLNSSNLKQKTPSFDITFYGDYYSNYREFSDFIFSSTDYKLVYKIGDFEYLLDIDINKLTKGDADEDGLFLSAKLHFSCKSLYYRKIEKTYTLNTKNDENRWDLKFDFIFNDDIPAEIEIENEGQLPSSFQLEINGYCKEPSVSIHNFLTGQEETINFNIEINQNEKLLFSTVDNNLYVYKQLADGTFVNALESVFYNDVNQFLSIPVGNNIVRIEKNISSAKLTLYELYYVI